MLDDDDARTLVALKRADGASFTELVGVAGLDPAHDLRDTQLRGIDFAGCDLSGYDFSGAALVGSSFRDAMIDDAIFARADVTSVRWPRGYVLGADGRIRRSRRPQLRAPQREIADALMQALRKGPPARAVAVLPPGVGKTAILAEIFSMLRNVKAFRRGLILAETIAERDQTVAHLRERGVETFDARELEREAAIRRGAVLVDTFGNYNRLRANLEPRSDDRPNPFKCSHVAFLSLPTRRRSDIAAIAEAKEAPAMIAFVESIPGAGIEERLTQGKLGELFGTITFRYDLAKALDDGVLGDSLIIDRTAVIAGLSDRRGPPEDRGAAVMDEVARDFAEQLEKTDIPAMAMLIAPDMENVELIAERLSAELRYMDRGRDRAMAVFRITTRVPRGDRQRAFNTPGAVIVTTPATADGLDIRRFALVGTVARVPPRLGALLRNPPPSREGGDLTVVDYAGSVAITVETVGRA